MVDAPKQMGTSRRKGKIKVVKVCNIITSPAFSYDNYSRKSAVNSRMKAETECPRLT